jgi:PAS domain S-box-containing protein
MAGDDDSDHGDAGLQEEALLRADAGTAATLEELRTLFHLSTEMLAIASFEGYFLVLSSAWTSTLGFTPAELCARPFLEFVHPDDVAVTATVAGRLRQNGRLIAFQNRYRRKDGTYRTLSWRAMVSEEKERYYCVARDVTERGDAHANAQLLAAVIELSGDAIIVQDAGGTITSWSPGAEQLSGYCAAEALGQPVVERLVSVDRSGTSLDFRNVVERSYGSGPMRIIMRRKDGSEVPVAITVAPLGDGLGRITGAITVARVVTT